MVLIVENFRMHLEFKLQLAEGWLAAVSRGPGLATATTESQFAAVINMFSTDLDRLLMIQEAMDAFGKRYGEASVQQAQRETEATM
eukprot:4476903-Prymnesium_polylepis.1